MISPSEIEIIAGNILKETSLSVLLISRTTTRIVLNNISFIDIFQSIHDPSKFAFHAKIGTKIFRVDCFPERIYRKLKSYPWHFHNGLEDNVVCSSFSLEKRKALIQFIKYIRKVIKSKR